MKKTVGLCIVLAVVLAACGGGAGGPGPVDPPHVHEWSSWTETVAPTLVSEGVETRTCSCGVSETRSSFIPITGANWADAIALMANTDAGNGSGTIGNAKKYTLTIGGDFVLNNGLNKTFDTLTHIEVTLKGSGTMSIGAATPCNLFRLNTNQKLIIDGDREGTTDKLILKGKAANSNSVIYLEEFSALELKNGAISGNTNSSYGAGVYVNDNGTFTMSGGTISGNTTNADGGGVRNDGTFTMEGGTISGNIAASNNGGGVNSLGTFIMKGGTISGNTASNGGGIGVGTFIMSGGTISGNTASNNGGGVYITSESIIAKYANCIIYGSGEGTDSNTAGGATNGHAMYWARAAGARYRNGTLGSGVGIGTGDDSSLGWTE